jgi:hypothetical protein
LELSAGYDADFSLPLLLESQHQELFNERADLGRLLSTARLRDARDFLHTALDSFADTVDDVLAEQDSQSDDLFVIVPEERSNAEMLQLVARRLDESLDREVSIPINVITGNVDVTGGFEERLNLSPLFSGGFSTVRGLFPGFDEAKFDTSLFADPTFGGMAPTLTQVEINDFLEGGPACLPCTDDIDCKPFGFQTLGRFECRNCFVNCTGQVSRCAFEGQTACEDGMF